MSDFEELQPILLVDDSYDDFEATARSFRRAHVANELVWKPNAAEAWRYLTSEEIPSPALILLDLNMPGMDGRDLLQEIKRSPKTRVIPTLILTTSADERDVARCYELGASTYIQKPVNFEMLVKAASLIKSYWFGVAILPKRTEHELPA